MKLKGALNGAPFYCQEGIFSVMHMPWLKRAVLSNSWKVLETCIPRNANIVSVVLSWRPQFSNYNQTI